MDKNDFSVRQFLTKAIYDYEDKLEKEKIKYKNQDSGFLFKDTYNGRLALLNKCSASGCDDIPSLIEFLKTVDYKNICLPENEKNTNMVSEDLKDYSLILISQLESVMRSNFDN
ncbi:hypothetical protein [Gaoshiqia sediminis]|uniref:Uncharacterized protein n=1 Tax=Gaoshiqia sediminis TaxID=2986998 RepID=A0AA42C8Q3_9BACT|nr:hypothetical protein [Gaoshiqia sediminis]MCW0482986.1 hypothetical protein [Gaoshiqia sediminis]